MIKLQKIKLSTNLDKALPGDEEYIIKLLRDDYKRNDIYKSMDKMFRKNLAMTIISGELLHHFTVTQLCILEYFPTDNYIWKLIDVRGFRLKETINEGVSQFYNSKMAYTQYSKVEQWFAKNLSSFYPELTDNLIKNVEFAYKHTAERMKRIKANKEKYLQELKRHTDMPAFAINHFHTILGTILEFGKIWLKRGDELYDIKIRVSNNLEIDYVENFKKKLKAGKETIMTTIDRYLHPQSHRYSYYIDMLCNIFPYEFETRYKGPMSTYEDIFEILPDVKTMQKLDRHIASVFSDFFSNLITYESVLLKDQFESTYRHGLMLEILFVQMVIEGLSTTYRSYVHILKIYKSMATNYMIMIANGDILKSFNKDELTIKDKLKNGIIPVLPNNFRVVSIYMDFINKSIDKLNNKNIMECWYADVSPLNIVGSTIFWYTLKQIHNMTNSDTERIESSGSINIWVYEIFSKLIYDKFKWNEYIDYFNTLVMFIEQDMRPCTFMLDSSLQILYSTLTPIIKSVAKWFGTTYKDKKIRGRAKTLRQLDSKELFIPEQPERFGNYTMTRINSYRHKGDMMIYNARNVTLILEKFIDIISVELKLMNITQAINFIKELCQKVGNHSHLGNNIDYVINFDEIVLSCNFNPLSVLKKIICRIGMHICFNLSYIMKYIDKTIKSNTIINVSNYIFDYSEIKQHNYSEQFKHTMYNQMINHLFILREFTKKSLLTYKCILNDGRPELSEAPYTNGKAQADLKFLKDWMLEFATMLYTEIYKDKNILNKDPRMAYILEYDPAERLKKKMWQENLLSNDVIRKIKDPNERRDMLKKRAKMLQQNRENAKNLKYKTAQEAITYDTAIDMKIHENFRDTLLLLMNDIGLLNFDFSKKEYFDNTVIPEGTDYKYCAYGNIYICFESIKSKTDLVIPSFINRQFIYDNKLWTLNQLIQHTKNGVIYPQGIDFHHIYEFNYKDTATLKSVIAAMMKFTTGLKNLISGGGETSLYLLQQAASMSGVIQPIDKLGYSKPDIMLNLIMLLRVFHQPHKLLYQMSENLYKKLDMIFIEYRNQNMYLASRNIADTFLESSYCDYESMLKEKYESFGKMKQDYIQTKLIKQESGISTFTNVSPELQQLHNIVTTTQNNSLTDSFDLYKILVPREDTSKFI